MIFLVYSPHGRGWTSGGVGYEDVSRIFPARAGLNLGKWLFFIFQYNIPRTGGVEPEKNIWR